MVRIRRAECSDSPGIVACLQAIWQVEPEAAYIETLIGQGLQKLWLLDADGEIGGFVAGFMTISSQLRRWEIDLLGLQVAWRGQGFAPQLIARSLEDGLAQHSTLARAVIRTDNSASQRSFARLGFSRSVAEYELYLWEGLSSEVPYPPDEQLAVFPVETLMYRGLWLENLSLLSAAHQQQAVQAARAQVAAEGRDNTGAFLPTDREQPAELSPALVPQNRSHWWTRPL